MIAQSYTVNFHQVNIYESIQMVQFDWADTSESIQEGKKVVFVQC